LILILITSATIINLFQQNQHSQDVPKSKMAAHCTVHNIHAVTN